MACTPEQLPHFGASKEVVRKIRGGITHQPRSGERMQPAAQAVGNKCKTTQAPKGERRNPINREERPKVFAVENHKWPREGTTPIISGNILRRNSDPKILLAE
jgi:hypothetical protein